MGKESSKSFGLSEMKGLVQERKTCPICGNVQVKTVFSVSGKEVLERKDYNLSLDEKKWLENFVFPVLHCSACDFYFHKFIPSGDFSYVIYNEWIKSERSFQKMLNYENFLYLLSYLVKLLNYYSQKKKKINEITILEVGSGWGKFLELAEYCGFRAFGIELSKAKIEYTKRRGLKVFHPDEIPENFFVDAISMFQILEHIPYPSEFLRFYLRYLKPEGLLILEVPNCSYLRFRFQLFRLIGIGKKLFGGYQPLEHVNCFTHKSLIKFLSFHGFVPLKTNSILHSRVGNFILREHWKERLKRFFLKSTGLIFKKIY